jgi:hypothetical protein
MSKGASLAKARQIASKGARGIGGEGVEKMTMAELGVGRRIAWMCRPVALKRLEMVRKVMGRGIVAG